MPLIVEAGAATGALIVLAEIQSPSFAMSIIIFIVGITLGAISTVLVDRKSRIERERKRANAKRS